MKSIRLLRPLLLAAMLGTGLFAAEKEKAAPARNDTYPLKTCVVSEEELGGMGAPVEFIYRQAGQPDRLVRFCCKMCVPKFKKEPAKYLAHLAPAGKTEAQPAPPKQP